MKVAMLVEDRDTGYLFLDAERADPEAQPYELSLGDGVLWRDVEDEDKTLWLEGVGTLRVVPRESYDFSGPMDSEWPIPTPTVVFCLRDFEILLAE